MAPLVKKLKNNINFECRVCVTAQHREMLDQVLDLFNIVPEYDLNIMKSGQSLNLLTGTILNKIEPIIDDFMPNIVLVHGDTTTTFSSTLASYYKKIDVGHIEAGLRTGNIYSPWPEEINRKLTGAIARFHFSPTNTAKENLLKEGISKEQIFVTGNTVIDALFETIDKLETNPSIIKNFNHLFNKIDFNKKIILVTGHRRENFGSGFVNICKAIKRIASKNNKIEIVYPVHLNPNVQKPVNEILQNINNVHLLPPLDYLPFVYLMNKSNIILTDSGGIQEEAPSLGKPVLVMRDNTERPEALSAGTVKLVGTDSIKISDEVHKLLNDINFYKKMSNSSNPYGDGNASKNIIKILEAVYEI